MQKWSQNIQKCPLFWPYISFYRNQWLPIQYPHCTNCPTCKFHVPWLLYLYLLVIHSIKYTRRCSFAWNGYWSYVDVYLWRKLSIVRYTSQGLRQRPWHCVTLVSKIDWIIPLRILEYLAFNQSTCSIFIREPDGLFWIIWEGCVTDDSVCIYPLDSSIQLDVLPSEPYWATRSIGL